MFPNVDSNDLPSSHTIIIEAEIYSSNTNANNGNTRVSKALTDRIINTCGDSHYISGQSKKVDPCLRLYVGAHAMCNNNSKLKTKNIGNGTLYCVKSIKLKEDAPPLRWKN